MGEPAVSLQDVMELGKTDTVEKSFNLVNRLFWLSEGTEIQLGKCYYEANQ